ncbi:DUF1801 domain-containing protein [Sphingobacterium sp. SRCM116780]|uniref:DUF1801 domain-containing protein n=1 Tax=Sphingobacterium sp. SRCM116780 TaxID=2907623 RepID=UPI001F179FD9|nr:DUF1801 domain-containing protein [Sphingobacterium sp. SRCM116780]UIR57535.1 DUF1801 domain-containing protein [Sphingobacterium sp. SRCM116780]
MVKNKTIATEESVLQYIEQVPEEQKRIDSHKLIALMEQVTGEPAKMWGPSIIGFGQYHYQYESGHEGDAALIGFSPRKAAISLYVYACQDDQKAYLESLGKFTMGKACIYIKKLADVNEDVLIKIMESTIRFLKTKYD